MKHRNTPYTLEELKSIYDNEYIEVMEYNNANDLRIRCKICGEIYKSKTNNLNRKQIHNKCTQFVRGIRHARFTLEEIKELYEDEHKEIIEYINARKILCRCKYCNEIYNTSIESLKKHCIHRKCQGLHDSRRTPEKCAEKLKKLQDVKHPYVEVLEYHAYNDVICKCKLCNKIIKVTSRSIYHKQVHQDCPMHQVSHGEIQVAYVLDYLNINYIQEYSFNDCRNIFPLRFDFYIPSLNVCIEYQGKQHYRPVQFIGETIEEANYNYERIVHNDNIKKEYCKKNNIHLIEIKYTEYDDIYNILESQLSQIK